MRLQGAQVRDHVRKFRWEWVALALAGAILLVALVMHLSAKRELREIAESRSAPAAVTAGAITAIHEVDTTTTRIESKVDSLARRVHYIEAQLDSCRRGL